MTLATIGTSELLVWTVALGVGAYLMGGIPWALIVGKRVAGVDLRTVGSGNLGATNVARTLGGKWAVTVFFLDMAKAAIPVAIAQMFAPAEYQDWLMVVAAICAILGHVYSPYIGFKGGKGIAVTAGAAAVMNPICLFWGTIAFFAVALTTRRVSLGSLTIGLIYPPLVLLFYPGRPINLAFSIAVMILIFWSHRANIRRLLKGEEPKVSWGIFRS